MPRAGFDPVREKPSPTDVDATEQLERPPATNVGAQLEQPAAGRRQVDRWSTVFTVFAAVALVALLLLGAAVISSQQVAAPSASPSTSASASPAISPSPIPRTVAPTETTPSPTPTPTITLPPVTPVPTVVPSVPLSPSPTRP
jgi:cytoskeletal protein RodZ